MALPRAGQPVTLWHRQAAGGMAGYGNVTASFLGIKRIYVRDLFGAFPPPPFAASVNDAFLKTARSCAGNPLIGYGVQFTNPVNPLSGPVAAFNTEVSGGAGYQTRAVEFGNVSGITLPQNYFCSVDGAIIGATLNGSWYAGINGLSVRNEFTFPLTSPAFPFIVATIGGRRGAIVWIDTTSGDAYFADDIGGVYIAGFYDASQPGDMFASCIAGEKTYIALSPGTTPAGRLGIIVSDNGAETARYYVNVDDPSIDAYISGNCDTSSMTASDKGFAFHGYDSSVPIYQTNGEFLLFTPDCTGYYLGQIIPADTNAALYLANSLWGPLVTSPLITFTPEGYAIVLRLANSDSFSDPTSYIALLDAAPLTDAQPWPLIPLSQCWPCLPVAQGTR